MGLIRSIKSWKQDRRLLSMQKHEIDYVKKLAKGYLKKIKGKSGYHTTSIRNSSLDRMCQFILKTKRGK